MDVVEGKQNGNQWHSLCQNTSSAESSAPPAFDDKDGDDQWAPFEALEDDVMGLCIHDDSDDQGGSSW